MKKYLLILIALGFLAAPLTYAAVQKIYIGAIGSNSDTVLVWDNINKKLGVGTSTPAGGFHIVSPSTTMPTLVVQATTSQTSNLVDIWNPSAATSYFNINSSGSTTIGSLTASGCVVNATTGGSLYCGVASGGGSASGTPGNVQFAGAAGAFNANQLFTWDNTNGWLGIGTTTIVSALSLARGTNAAAGINFGDGTSNLYRSTTGTLAIDGQLRVGGASGGLYQDRQVTSVGAQAYTIIGNRTGTFPGYGVILAGNAASTYTSGIGGVTQITGQSFSPTTGTGVFNGLEMVQTINQTSTSSGITRGLYVNPTLTSAYDFRAIETAPTAVTINNANPTSSVMSVLFNPSTYGTSSSTVYTLATSSTVRIAGAPIASTTGKTLLTKSIGLLIDTNAVNASTTNAYGLYVAAPTGATNNYNSVFMGGSVGFGTSTPVAGVDIQGNAGVMPFRVSSSSGTSLFEIENTGNIGINTTTAGSLLSVVGYSGSTIPLLTVASSSGQTLLQVTPSSTATSVVITGSGTNNIFNVASSSGTSVLMVTAGGNVGIGTTTPAANVHIVDTAATIRIGEALSNKVGCIEMYDAAATTTLTYLYVSGTALIVTTTKPAFCK